MFIIIQIRDSFGFLQPLSNAVNVLQYRFLIAWIRLTVYLTNALDLLRRQILIIDKSQWASLEHIYKTIEVFMLCG